MRLIVKEGHENYAAKVVRLGAISPLPNSDRIKTTEICGSDVTVGVSTQEGELGIYFPTECKISSEILSKLNYFSNPLKNADGKTKGYFGDHGRVKAVKFRGNPSNGFFIPLKHFCNVTGVFSSDLLDNLWGDFNSIEYPQHTIEVCEKYIPANNPSKSFSSAKPMPRSVQALSKDRIKGFQFHYKTLNIQRYLDEVLGKSAYVSKKYHGTSAIVGRLPYRRDLGFLERIGKWIQDNWSLDLGVEEYSPRLFWASRTVLKGVEGVSTSPSSGFYSTDVWGEVANFIGPFIPEGYTVYGEIIGWAGERPIQKGYTYGIPKGQWKFVPYRITELIGDVTEEIPPYLINYYLHQWFGDEILEKDSEIVPLYFELTEPLTEEIIKNIRENKVEIEDPENPGKPMEGVVFRIGKAAYKLKNKAFLELESKALDNGEPDEVE